MGKKNKANWFENKLKLLAKAMNSTENDIFAQKHSSDSTHTITQRVNQGTLFDALKQGEVTQDVKDLRWRTFKILEHARNIRTVEDGVDEYGDIKYKTIKNVENTSKIKLCGNKEHKLEILFKNDSGTTSFTDVFKSLEGFNYELKDLELDDVDKEGETIIKKNAMVLSGEDVNSRVKNSKMLNFLRETLPQFKLEDYTEKLQIRSFDSEYKILELHVSRYRELMNTKSNLFISKLEQLLKSGRNDDIFNIKQIGFTTFQTLGANDFNKFLYEISEFMEMVEFNGCFVIRFKCIPLIEHEYILAEFVEADLENKYNNKEAKDTDNTVHFDNF